LVLVICYHGDMGDVRGGSKIEWDVVLNGYPHVVDLDQIWFSGSVNDLRAVAYREAGRRRRGVKTRKLSPTQLEIQAEAVEREGRCVCGAPVGGKHRDNCSWLRDQYRLRAANFIAATTLEPPPALQEQPPTDETLDGAMTPEEEEALLGPCSCGQSPTCLPTCSRFS
jgi:hypothetical protein